MNYLKKRSLYCYVKRSFDLIISMLCFLVSSPFYVFFALFIKFSSPGPILFKQKRIGRNKKAFNIYKFRTMKIDAPKEMPTHLLENPDEFITKIGGVLRKTSLDELPQIFNVIKGDMSIIGPRPALWNQFDLIYERDKYEVHSVRPGITGLAQISGRDELDIETKAKYDGEYVEKFGFLIDLKIFFLTFKSVLKKEGIREGEVPKQ